jgi:hypothetical protein
VKIASFGNTSTLNSGVGSFSNEQVMNWKSLTLFVIVLVSIGGCSRLLPGDDPHDMHREPVEMPEPPFTAKDARAEFANNDRLTGHEREVLADYIGLSETDARALAAEQGREFRCGSGFTADYQPGRISVQIKNGIVARGSVEPFWNRDASSPPAHD